MTLNRYKIGDLICESTIKNTNGVYSLEDVKGVNSSSSFCETKANMEGVELDKYKVVYNKYFAYNPSRINLGSIAINNSSECIVSPMYVVFYVKRTDLVLPEFLFIYLQRKEFLRSTSFYTTGSVRDTFDFNSLSSLELELPSIYVQQKYVSVYLSLIENQKAYERGLEDLKLICDSYIENIRKKIKLELLGKYIKRVDVRNGVNGSKNVKGVSTSKEFRDPTSKVNKDELANYKVVKPRQISFVQTTHNEKVFCNALNNTKDDIVVTSVNEVFECDESQLLPEYLCMIFNRKEFDRYARFHSWGSARETFTWDDLVQVKIAKPSISEQKSIVDIYNTYKIRKEINERLKNQIKDICPILIKGSIEEGKKN